MNLFMHYAFDLWMQRANPTCPFARYADDAVVHCVSQQQAEDVLQSIALWLAECGLTIHPEKSRIVYCKSSGRNASYPYIQFTFLGFTFRSRRAVNRQNRQFTSFSPGGSVDAMKRMRKEVRGWRIHRRTAVSLAELAKQYNPVLRGWWNYFGSFYPSAMHSFFIYFDGRLMKWARRKYKTLELRKQGSVEWLRKVKKSFPKMFVYWSVARYSVG